MNITDKALAGAVVAYDQARDLGHSVPASEITAAVLLARGWGITTRGALMALRAALTLRDAGDPGVFLND